MACRLLVCAATAALIQACGGSTTSCGPGTHQSGNQCASDGIFDPSGTGGSGGTGGVTPTAPAPPPGPYPSAADAAATCAEPGTVVDEFGLSGVRAWLPRIWYHCSGAYLFQNPYDGLEIAADGKWYFLDDQGGTLLRRAGFGAGGTWTLDDLSGMNGPTNQVQVNFESNQGGGIPSFVRFATDPLKLQISAYPGDTSEYLAVQQ